jgi:hypothetical protein
MHTDFEKRIIEFIGEQSGVNTSRIDLGTTLFGDLGIDGDDASDLMKCFGEKFKVDMSSYKHELHFGPEASFCPQFLVQLLLVRWFLSEQRKVGTIIPITVRHLLEAAQSGKWIERW